MEDQLIRRYIFFFLAAALLLMLARIGYLYVEVGRGIAGRGGETPSVFYGRPAEIRKGDHLGNLRFSERLQRLSYKKVSGAPTAAGTYSAGQGTVQIFLRNEGSGKISPARGPVEIRVKDGRVAALVSDGGQLASIRLEPEEIGRITGSEKESRRPVSLSAISPYLQSAVIASEDKRFYSHVGIDILAMGRALFVNIRERRFVQGGSTITQQLARNLFLPPQKTLRHKLREAELALILELRLSKKQILEMYLDKLNFGQDGLRGIYGVEEAAGFHSSKPAKDLSLEESALLAGIIRSPRRSARLRNGEPVKESRNAVLKRMLRLGMIREDEFQKASGAAVKLPARSAPVRISSYFLDYIQRITADELGGEKLYRTGYRYNTSLDPAWQAAAEEAVTRGIEEIEKTAFPAGEPLQAALVVVDPATGAMTAMVGGRSYKQSRFNRAVDAKRQPGSAFKPFVLLAALAEAAPGKEGRTLSGVVSGEPVSIATPEGIWTPSNFENKKYGNITIRKTIEDSVNTATVRLAQEIGLTEVLKAARLAGITSPLLPVPSMALGSFEVTPVELAYAYTTIASGGIRFGPFPLYSVTTAGGDTIIDRTVHGKKAIDPRVAYLTSYTLQGVLERGTAKEARAMGISFPASGKTGTTNGNRDSWFVGYTPEVVCAVWVGYDSGGDTGLTGAQGALHIWARFMRAFYSQSGPPAVTKPEGIETAEIDPRSGYLATSLCPQRLRESYLQGTAPREACPDHPVGPGGDNIQGKQHGIGNFLRSLFR